MYAVQIDKFGPAEELKYRKVEKPVPSENQVLIKVSYTSLNYADIMQRNGVYANSGSVVFPMGFGYECTGEVIELGKGVSGFKEGDKVIHFGGNCYAEYVLADVGPVYPYKIDDEVDLMKTCMLPVAGLTAYHLLTTVGKVKENDWVVVYAPAGGVGSSIIKLAKLFNANVIGITSSEEKINFAESHGLVNSINYKKENVFEKVMEITSGKGADLILDSVGGEKFEDNFKLLKPVGDIILYGYSQGKPVLFKEEQKFDDVFFSGKSVRPFSLASIIFHYPDQLRASLKTMIDFIKEGKFSPAITKIFSLSEAAEAHRLMGSLNSVGKIIFKV